MTNELKWLFPDYMYQYEVLKLAFSIFSNYCPPYFDKYLDFSYVPTKITRNRTYYNVTTSNTKYGYKTFKYIATTLWLNLPASSSSIESNTCENPYMITDEFYEYRSVSKPIYESESPSIFKKTLKRMYLDKQLEESAPSEEEHVCNYSCIDSVVNYVLQDSEESA